MHRSHSSAQLYIALAVALGLIGTGTLFWRAAAAPTPTYASDEYAYLAHGKFLHETTELLRNDPGLQRLPNRLYFRLVNAAYRWTSNGHAALKF